jgi:hypothetical protein
LEELKRQREIHQRLLIYCVSGGDGKAEKNNSSMSLISSVSGGDE